MPGGVPPKRKNDSVFKEIELIAPLTGQKSHRWKCNHCCKVFAWCSVGRVRNHLACMGKIVGICLSVPLDVKQREAAVIAVKSREKKKRKLDHKALEEAATARSALHAERTKEKLKRGIRIVKDGKHVAKRLRKGAFGANDELNWALLDEEIVDFFCLHGTALHLLETKKWARILDLARKTSAGYRSPNRRNDGRGACFETILQGRQVDVNAQVDVELAKIVTCGATIVSDAATVHRRPVANFMLKAACHSAPMMLDLVDATQMIQTGENRDATWYAKKTVALVHTTPLAGRCVVLMVGDTVAEQLAMFDMVEEACPWMSGQLGVCHGMNLILKICGAIPGVASVMKECMEVNDWFLAHKLQHAVFEKHAGGRALCTPCDSRYGYNFISMLKLLRMCAVCQKAVGDPAYIEANLENDVVKPRVNDTGFWNGVADVCEMVFPYLRLLRCADSNAPMLSKVAGRKKAVEEKFQGWLDGDVQQTGSGTLITEEMIDELIRPIFLAKDHTSQSGPTYWENLVSEFALAAAVLDPEFHDQKPWMWPGAIDAVEAQFRKRYQGSNVDGHVRLMMMELDSYKDKTGKFVAAHLWPRRDADGFIIPSTLKPAWKFWNSCAVMSAAIYLAPFATVQTAQIASNSISERGHKSYKFVMNKRRAAKLGRDRLGGRGPLGLDIVQHRENLKFISNQESMDDESASIEIVLRSFAVGDEAHFVKEWLKRRETLVQRKVLNCIEGWEANAVKQQTRVNRFKLQHKYMGLVMHDKEDGGSDTYDEIRRVCAIVWDRGSKSFKANTELLKSAEPSDVPLDVSTNQPYGINLALHACLAAAKLVPEGAAQVSVHLIQNIELGPRQPNTA